MDNALEIDAEKKINIPLKITQLEYIMLVASVRSSRDGLKANPLGVPKGHIEEATARGMALEKELLMHANEVFGESGLAKILYIIGAAEDALKK